MSGRPCQMIFTRRAVIDRLAQLQKGFKKILTPLKNRFSILDDSVQGDTYQRKKRATAQKIRNLCNPISTWHGLDESWSSQYEQVVEAPSPKLKELNSLAHADVSERT